MIIAIVAGLIILAALIIFGGSSALDVVRYTLKSDKVSAPVRLALVTDLHSCKYGENQSELINVIRAQSPCAVLLGGDIFDDDMDNNNSKVFISAIAAEYACYYVTGNHEIWSGKADEMRSFLSDCGVAVLQGDCAVLSANGQMINICGIDDPAEKGQISLLEQLKKAAAAADTSRFTVLLTHRPELISDYLCFDFDLILAGHAHGGQWRIPGLINGLFAPNQGLFPKYAGGEYTFDTKTMIVSRGLARESTCVPRIFNRPELVIIDIE